MSNPFAFSLHLCFPASIGHAYFCSLCYWNTLVKHRVFLPYIFAARFRSQSIWSSLEAASFSGGLSTPLVARRLSATCLVDSCHQPLRNQEIPPPLCHSPAFPLLSFRPNIAPHHHRRPLHDCQEQEIPVGSSSEEREEAELAGKRTMSFHTTFWDTNVGGTFSIHKPLNAVKTNLNHYNKAKRHEPSHWPQSVTR